MENSFRGKDRKAHYDSTSQNDKLMINLWDINHIMHLLYEGRGGQKRILMILLEVGSITQRGLTEWLGIQPGSVSEVLAKLVKSGLITRTENSDDRRTANIMLTEQGRKIAEEAIAQRKIRQEKMFSCFSEEEKATLITLLEKLNENWQELYQNVEEHPCGRHGHGRHGHHHDREGR